jgi:MYXO-CTERM domain-containing protein
MLALFGPPIPDLVAPTIQILAPGEGEELDYASNFDLTFVLDDDRRPQILDIVIYVDDVEITDAVLIDQEHTFPVTGGDPPGHGLPNGTHTIRIEAFDEGGNPASDEVSFVIVNGPEAPAADDTGSGAATAGPSDGDGDGDTAGDSSVGADGGGRGGDDGGCGCRSPGPAPLGLATFLLVALGVRRRR